MCCDIFVPGGEGHEYPSLLFLSAGYEKGFGLIQYRGAATHC